MEDLEYKMDKAVGLLQGVKEVGALLEITTALGLNIPNSMDKTNRRAILTGLTSWLIDEAFKLEVPVVTKIVDMVLEKTEEYYQKLRESVSRMQEEKSRAEEGFGGVRYRNPRPPMDIPEMGPGYVPLEGATAVNNELNPVNILNPVHSDLNPTNNLMPPILTDSRMLPAQNIGPTHRPRTPIASVVGHVSPHLSSNSVVNNSVLNNSVLNNSVFDPVAPTSSLPHVSGSQDRNVAPPSVSGANTNITSESAPNLPVHISPSLHDIQQTPIVRTSAPRVSNYSCVSPLNPFREDIRQVSIQMQNDIRHASPAVHATPHFESRSVDPIGSHVMNRLPVPNPSPAPFVNRNPFVAPAPFSQQHAQTPVPQNNVRAHYSVPRMPAAAPVGYYGQRMRELKLNGKIVDPSEVGGMTYGSLMFQIESAQVQGYPDVDILNAIIKATSSSSLRGVLETVPGAPLSQVIATLKAHFTVKGVRDVFHELGRGKQGEHVASENALQFCMRMIQLRELVSRMNVEEGGQLTPQLIQQQFLDALNTGLKGEIRLMLQGMLRVPNVTDAVLMKEITELMLSQKAHENKTAEGEVSTTAEVNIVEDRSRQTRNPLMAQMSKLSADIQNIHTQTQQLIQPQIDDLRKQLKIQERVLAMLPMADLPPVVSGPAPVYTCYPSGPNQPYVSPLPLQRGGGTSVPYRGGRGGGQFGGRGGYNGGINAGMNALEINEPDNNYNNTHNINNNNNMTNNDGQSAVAGPVVSVPNQPVPSRGRDTFYAGRSNLMRGNSRGGPRGGSSSGRGGSSAARGGVATQFLGTRNYSCTNCMSSNSPVCAHCFRCGESGHPASQCPLN